MNSRTSIENLTVAAALALVCSNISLAQTPPAMLQDPGAILEIQIQNNVMYINNVADPSKLASSPAIVALTAATLGNFKGWVSIGDIVSVNGKPAKGVAVGRGTQVSLLTNPPPGYSIGDLVRFDGVDFRFEIQQPDGTPIGTIMTLGFNGGAPPPGAPPRAFGGNIAIVGGTGAFLGARGQHEAVSNAQRFASALEDPANRRINGGGQTVFILHLIPASRPAIVNTANGPAVVHASDSSLVTAAKPAKSGEVLTLFATGLGPTRPALEPGKVFTANPLQVANSPVEVSVGGQAAEVLYAGGYPGANDGFQVNFRLPSGVAPGMAAMQLTAAWIAGSPVSIPVQ